MVSCLEVLDACITRSRRRRRLEVIVLDLLFGPLAILMGILWPLLTSDTSSDAEGRRLFSRRWRRKLRREESEMRARFMLAQCAPHLARLPAESSIEYSTEAEEIPADADQFMMPLRISGPREDSRDRGSADVQGRDSLEAPIYRLHPPQSGGPNIRTPKSESAPGIISIESARRISL